MHNTEKRIFVVDSFNLNYLDYINHLEIQNFYNRIFARGSIPLITRPTRVTSKAVSVIGNIFTTIFTTSLELKKAIIKSDASDHFPDHSLTSSSKIHKENKKFTIHKRVIHNTNLTAFKSDLCNVNWNSVNHLPERKST